MISSKDFWFPIEKVANDRGDFSESIRDITNMVVASDQGGFPPKYIFYAKLLVLISSLMYFMLYFFLAEHQDDSSDDTYISMAVFVVLFNAFSFIVFFFYDRRSARGLANRVTLLIYSVVYFLTLGMIAEALKFSKRAKNKDNYDSVKMIALGAFGIPYNVIVFVVVGSVMAGISFADPLGRRNMYLYGLAFFIGASLLSYAIVGRGDSCEKLTPEQCLQRFPDRADIKEGVIKSVRRTGNGCWLPDLRLQDTLEEVAEIATEENLAPKL